MNISWSTLWSDLHMENFMRTFENFQKLFGFHENHGCLKIPLFCVLSSQEIIVCKLTRGFAGISLCVVMVSDLNCFGIQI